MSSPYKIAIYGKGGIGKSTTASNLSYALSQQGLRVMQIGCDPKADSTLLLRKGAQLRPVLSVFRERGNALLLEDIVLEADKGIFCVEAGGPLPGHGCAGRGIVAALECLARKDAYARLQIDVVIYDVLGDVVCGGFAMPMRTGYADTVFILSSGEKMAIYAAANVAMAVQSFAGRGYAQLGGFFLTRRGIEGETEAVQGLAKDFGTEVLADIPFSREVQKAEEAIVKLAPHSPASEAYLHLAQRIQHDFL